MNFRRILWKYLKRWRPISNDYYVSLNCGKNYQQKLQLSNFDNNIFPIKHTKIPMNLQ